MKALSQDIGWSNAIAISSRRLLVGKNGCWRHQKAGSVSGAKKRGQDKLKRFALADTAPDALGQLYNLDTDPRETDNLYFKHPEIVNELKSLLENSKVQGRSARQK